MPTALAAPLLSTLETEAEQLEKVLEVALVEHEHPRKRDVVSSLLRLTSSARLMREEHTRLLEEIETLKVLRRRVAAVKPSTIASAGGF